MKNTNLLSLTADILTKAKVPAVLIGGYAVNYHGLQRHTQDVDFLMTDEDYAKVKPLFEKAGFRQEIRNNLFARLENANTLPKEVDIVFVDRETFLGILDETQTAEIQGRTFRVASLNHLLALKFHAMKQNIRRRGFRDLSDVLELAEANGIDVQSKEFKGLCLRYGGAEVFRMVQGLFKK